MRDSPNGAWRFAGRSIRVTYRIQRVRRQGAIVFVLSGVLDTAHAARLQELLATETGARLVLDLKDVTRVDRVAVRYLARVEAAGADIINCPDYVRSWIAGESGGGQEPSQ
jgi:ABC-type transporter Mla MlaB component